MKCPICGKDVELQKKQVGLDESGNPILNEYAICRDCKKQWNLDKQREKKTAAKAMQKAAEETAAQESVASAIDQMPTVAPDETTAVADAVAAAVIAAEAATADSLETAAPKKVKKADGTRPKKKKRPVDTNAADLADRPAPKKKALSPEEKAARTVNGERPKKKKRPVSETTKQVELPKKSKSSAERPVSKKHLSTEADADDYLGNVPPKKVRKKREHAVKQNYEDMLATDPRSIRKHKRTTSKPVEEPEVFDDLPKAHFRVIRVLLGLASIVGCGFFVYRGFTSGITSISAITDSSLGITFTVLASGMLLSGLLLLLMQRTNNIFAFLLPMLIYLGCGTFAFLNRTEETILLYAAIGCAILAVLFIILAITSRGDEEDYDSFDDDDYYDDED